MFSPIVFFAYKRPFHTFHSLNALSKNIESKNTDLIAYIDGPSNVKELHLIDDKEYFYCFNFCCAISFLQGKYHF